MACQLSADGHRAGPPGPSEFQWPPLGSGIGAIDHHVTALAAERHSVGKTHRWILFITSFIMSGMTKRLQAIGNSSGIIIDRAILDLLGITQETDLDLETDGKRLIITPLQGDDRRKRLAKVQSRALRNHAETFRKLAK